MKRPIRDLICPACGKQFQTVERTQTYCSFKCARTKGNGIKPKTVEHICPECEKTFELRISDHRVKKGQIPIFCSRTCYFNSLRKKNVKNDEIIKKEKEKVVIEKVCPICNTVFTPTGYNRRQKTCSRECGTKLRSINRGHKAYYENGYIVEFCNGYNKKGNVKQHRRIMEEHLGRRLEKWEVVHHINGDRTDNRIENLQLMTWGEHSSLHRKEEKASGKHLFGGYHNN